MVNVRNTDTYRGKKIKLYNYISELYLLATNVDTIDILYTLDSASNYSAIQKLKPWCRLGIFPWNEKTRMFSIS
jgi:hypothetical protein